ncbi:MAG: DUF1918 domain-containing protein [Actinomycetota bacterium]
MNIHAVIGDEILVDSMQVGHSPRCGEVLEVIGEGDVQHYLVRWDDGHVSTFYPTASCRAVHFSAHH